MVLDAVVGFVILIFTLWASEETGVQVDLVQARLYELFRRLDSQESLTRTLQATQKQQNHSDNLMINGLVKAGAKAGTSGRMRLGQRTIPRLCQRGMETQNSLMTMSLMSPCTREARTQVIIAFLLLD